MDFILLLAQDLPVPDTEILKSGDVQQILAWIIGVLLLALVALLGWHLKCQAESKRERREIYIKHAQVLQDLQTKREKDHKRMMKIALASQKALEIWAGIETKLADEDDEE